MKIPDKYNLIWEKSYPLLQQGRPGDDNHALEVMNFVLDYADPNYFDVLVPVAIMHDIGHSSILLEHFKYVTGKDKLTNGKLVHMLVGAKIAKDILTSIKYDEKKIDEIVELISMHDADQLEGVNVKEIYNTENKKMFHDIDCMDRYNSDRIKAMEKSLPDKDKIMIILKKGLDNFFYPKFRQIAEKRLKDIKIN